MSRKQIRAELNGLKQKCDTQSGKQGRVTSLEMKQHFTPDEVDRLVDEILANLEFALELLQVSEAKRWK